MRGGKRTGSGRHPKYGTFKDTTIMRVPAELKQNIIAYIEDICIEKTMPINVAESNTALKPEDNDCVTISKQKLSQAETILVQSLQLKANAGGAIKTGIRKALNLLQI